MAKETNGPSKFYVPTKIGTLIIAPSVPAQELANTASVATSITASSASTSHSGHLTNYNVLTPNRVRAGVGGYVSITEKSSWSQFTPHIGWYSDYWPNTTDSGSVKRIPTVSPAFICYTVLKLHQFIYVNHILHAGHYIFFPALGRRPSLRHQLRRRPPCRLQVPYLHPTLHDGLLQTRLDTT